MTNEEARRVLGDVSAYLASRASLENETLAGHTFIDICKAIKALKQLRWIPVSERLPEVTGEYLITKMWRGSYSGEIYKEVDISTYDKMQHRWDCIDVIAWMPLPQPYTESEDEE